MKAKILVLVIVVAMMTMIVGLTSCSKDDDGVAGEMTSDIVGTWMCDYYCIDGSSGNRYPMAAIVLYSPLRRTARRYARLRWRAIPTTTGRVMSRCPATATSGLYSRSNKPLQDTKRSGSHGGSRFFVPENT